MTDCETYNCGDVLSAASGLTYHSMQHCRLSRVCAPSRNQVVPACVGSVTVWQRPGHFVDFNPSMNADGRSSSTAPDVCTVMNFLARCTARVAFWYWCFPARPVVQLRGVHGKYHVEHIPSLIPESPVTCGITTNSDAYGECKLGVRMVSCCDKHAPLTLALVLVAPSCLPPVAQRSAQGHLPK